MIKKPKVHTLQFQETNLFIKLSPNGEEELSHKNKSIFVEYSWCALSEMMNLNNAFFLPKNFSFEFHGEISKCAASAT